MHTCVRERVGVSECDGMCASMNVCMMYVCMNVSVEGVGRCIWMG